VIFTLNIALFYIYILLKKYKKYKKIDKKTGGVLKKSIKKYKYNFKK
jgi:hypothetical protein